MSDAARVRFRDVKPYWVPEALEDLCGPYSGTIDLPHHVRWLDDRFDVDVAVLGRRVMAYQALLAEATVEEQERFLNARRLIETWPELRMDRRVRDLWESRFPVLRERGA